jgi:bifunctional UDP-N-acetylglucosamine pyrophosphorylase/glucosamine-1-phosphate N-acetyltransferase
MNKTAAVIMAAGKSKRMKTKLPKMLHPLMGRPLIDYVLDAAAGAGIGDMVMVVGHEKDLLMQHVGERASFAVQEEQMGTGHAVLQALPRLQGFTGDVAILSGDMPLLTAETLKGLIAHHRAAGAAITVLTAMLEDPGRLGRIVRDSQGRLQAIVEAADATPAQLAIREINTGTYVFQADHLRRVLPNVGSDNAQKEIYLTDTIGMTIQAGLPVEALPCTHWQESLGVNSRSDLAAASTALRNTINEGLMASGVTLYDPANTYVEASVEIAPDTLILPGCMITGPTRIGSGCIIGPHCRIDASTIGNGVQIRESVILSSTIGNDVNVGPYAHLRPDTIIEDNGKIGNFVETKKSRIGAGSKVPHLSYVGDATVGRKVNIGAGTITCNYDGVRKNPTVIKDNAFIGTNSSLVAPVTIGEGSATGAGSVVTKDVPDHKLAVGVPARVIKTLPT